MANPVSGICSKTEMFICLKVLVKKKKKISTLTTKTKILFRYIT